MTATVSRFFLFLALAASAGAVADSHPPLPKVSVPLIVYLGLTPPTANHKAFHERLKELGYVNKKNLVIEYWIANGNQERLERYAVEAARGNVNLIIAHAPPGQVAVKKATSTIPVVFFSGSDPVGLGLVKNLARPGGNFTGVSNMPADLTGKRLQMLKELVPGLNRVGILTRSGNRNHQNNREKWADMARELGLEPMLMNIKGPDDFEHAFATMANNGLQAVCLIQDSVFYIHRQRLADAALSQRLPTLSDSKSYAEAGTLISYGFNPANMWRQAADYVVRIIEGANPGDLPVLQPTELELVINLRTASTLGITIPPSIMTMASEVLR